MGMAKLNTEGLLPPPERERGKADAEKPFIPADAATCLRLSEPARGTGEGRARLQRGTVTEPPWALICSREPGDPRPGAVCHCSPPPQHGTAGAARSGSAP